MRLNFIIDRYYIEFSQASQVDLGDFIETDNRIQKTIR